jgi:hypothetical protein
MAPGMVKKELADLTEEPSWVARRSDFLDGYAYDETSAGWRLTAFGAGLKALFRIPPPGLGT